MLMRSYPEADEYLALASTLLPEFARPYAYRALMQIARDGDTELAAQTLAAGISAGAEPGEDGFLAYSWILADVLAKRYEEAERKIDVEGLDVFNTQFFYAPASLVKAETSALRRQPAEARSQYESARASLETLLDESPEDERFHSAMALALAGLGRNAEAIAEAERGVELMPRERDAYKALYRLEELARVLTMVGEHDRAVEVLTDLVESPGIISAAWLRIDPRYDALRDHPGFQALTAADPQG